jgi:hypothetical protein
MFEDNEDEVDEALLAWLEEEGALNWVGMDDDGERVLTINPDKMQEVYPELYDAMMDDLNYMLGSLKTLGYITSELDEDGEEVFAISEEGRKIMEKFGYGHFEGDLND